MARTAGFPLLVLLSLALTQTAALAAESPATLYTGAQVFTGLSDVPDASWFVVREGRFAAVGQGEVPAEWARTASRVELSGRFVLPGFVDAHVHFVEGGLSLLQVDLSSVKTREELAEALARAAQAPMGHWVIARNLSLAPFGGKPPTPAELEPLLPPAPALLTLEGGHHVYVNRAGLAWLGIDRHTPQPSNGRILRDAAGEPTGLLVDEAAWSALRHAYEDAPPEFIARAMLEAQRRALAYGITSVGDNTFFPLHAKQYARLSEAGLLKLRVSARSFGPLTGTKFVMRSLGRHRFGVMDDSLRYFGDKFFLTDALSMSEVDTARGPAVPGGRTHYTLEELKDIFASAGPYGLAFHTQGREGAERLVEARNAVRSRRSTAEGVVDIIDHCGDCGGDLPARIRDAGFRVTILPCQLHELPELQRIYGERARELLPLRALYAAGLEPAITSDWPEGLSVTYPELPESFVRLGLAPLAQVAVAVSGRTPSGSPIPGAEERTLPLGGALRGITSYGASAIGRGDVGRIAPGALADFVVLEHSPFSEEPVALYREEVLETYIAGERVYGADSAPAEVSEQQLQAFASHPVGLSPSPVLGYDPTVGFIVGGALFVYPYEERGWLGSVQLLATVPRMRLQLGSEFTRLGLWGRVSPELSVNFSNWGWSYFGYGMSSSGTALFDTEPREWDTRAGLRFALGQGVSLSTQARYLWREEVLAEQITERSGPFEARITGHSLGVRAALEYDSRDARFSPRRGTLATVWAEGWGVQGGERAPRLRLGASAAHFFALRAPDVILATRLEVGASVGDRAYATQFTLGGSERLRGYPFNRFRGDHVADGALELRFPLWSFLSGVAFGEAGKVWLQGLHERPGAIAYVGGVGLRIGLPPDRAIKLRFDLGASPEGWNLFFGFGEAF